MSQGRSPAAAHLSTTHRRRASEAATRWSRSHLTELLLLAAVAVLYALFAVRHPSEFATVSNAENMARQGGILLVVAVGQMFALLVGGFDISVGATMGFVSVIAAMAMTPDQWDLGLSGGIAIGIATGALIGFVNGFLIARLGVSAFVVTLAMLTFLLGLGNVISDGTSIFGMPANFQYFGSADWGPISSSLGMAIIVLVLAWFLLDRARFGLYVYGIGGSRETCQLAGVPVVRYEILAYMVCSMFAGVAGIMLASRTTVGQAELGETFELQSIAAAVIGGVAVGGGVGRLSGVVLGVALIIVLRTGVDIAGVSEFRQRMLEGAVVILAVLITQLRYGMLRDITNVLRFRSRITTGVL